MVPVDPVHAALLSEGVDTLTRVVESIRDTGTLAEVFTAFALREYAEIDVASAVAAACLLQGAQRTHQSVAVLGYALEAEPQSKQVSARLDEDLIWIAGRSHHIGSHPADFFTDAVALLGIAIGARRARATTTGLVRTWMDGFVDDSFARRGAQPWERCLAAAACRLVGCETAPGIPRDADAADARIFLRGKECLPAAPQDWHQTDSQSVLRLAKGSVSLGLSPVVAAMRLYAVKHIIAISPTPMSNTVGVEDVHLALTRVSDALLHWTWEEARRTSGGEPRKWHVDNEYHVQNLLWTILRPICPDLVAEDYTEEAGPIQPRLDLGIPTLRLAIEVKFARQRDTLAKVVREIAEDASLYLVEGSKYERVMPFVWDDARRTEEHGELVRGLSKISGVVSPVVVSRPGRCSSA